MTRSTRDSSESRVCKSLKNFRTTLVISFLSLFSREYHHQSSLYLLFPSTVFYFCLTLRFMNTKLLYLLTYNKRRQESRLGVNIKN